MSKLVVKDVVSGYGTPVLRGVNFEVKSGEFVGVIGPNGAGKSTLVKTVTRIVPIITGDVFIDGISIRSLSARQLARKISVVGQSFAVGFDYKVKDIVRMGRFSHASRTLDAIEPHMIATGVWELRERSFHSLSGGEKQRVIISQALAQEADLMILDEPTSNLDINHQIEVFDLLDTLRHKNEITTVAVLHDLNLASLYCDRIIVLANGVAVSQGSPNEVLTKENISKIYGASVNVVSDEMAGRPVVVLKRSDYNEKY